MIPGITASTRRKSETIPRQVVMEWDGNHYVGRTNHTGGQWRQDVASLRTPQPRWFHDEYQLDSEEVVDMYISMNHMSVYSGFGAGLRELTFYVNSVNFRWVFEEAWITVNGEYFNFLDGTIAESEGYGQHSYRLILDPVDPSPFLPNQDNHIEGRIVMNPRPDE